MSWLALAGRLGLVAGVLAGLGSASWAGPFGGFSSDGSRYLVGNNLICEVLAARSDATPACRRGDVKAIAAAGFRKGTRQSGAAAFRAHSTGTRIELFAPGAAAPFVRWVAGGTVSRITAVYAQADRGLVAVEFEARQLGRMTIDAVAFASAAAPPGSGPVPAQPQPAAAQGPGNPPPAVDPGQLAQPARPDAGAAARRRGEQALARRKWNAAERAFAEALAVDANDLPARYGLAAAQAQQNKRAEAIAALRVLAGATASDKAAEYLVDARGDKAFRQLRKDKTFRQLVGLDPAPGRPVTAYERLIAGKGVWEQTLSACDRAGVTLDLARHPRTFTLTVVLRCDGVTDTLRLHGTWSSEGSEVLVLTFPNEEGPDETTRCELRACNDGSGEDCLTCQVDQDLGFTARPARR
jgi:hypothetical protein